MSTPPKGRRALIMAAAAGTCAIAAGAGIPAALVVLSPLRATASSGRWVRTLRVDQLKENEPKRVAIVSDRRDAWTVEKNVELGSVWLVKRGDSPEIDAHGKESLNFQLSMLIYDAIAAILCLVLIGIPILIALWVMNTVCVIIASIRASEGKFYRYPFTIRFLS